MLRVTSVGPDQSAYDENVAEDDYAERQRADDGERYPRPHVILEVPVLRGRPAADAVKYRLHRAVAARPQSELGAASPQNVEVLSNGRHQRPDGKVLGAPRLAGRRAPLEWKTDGNKAIQGEDDADPDGSVAASVEGKLLQFAEHCVRLLTA